METAIGLPCVLLTEEVIVEKMFHISNSEKPDIQRLAEIRVCEHILDLLRDGHLLTIDANNNIKLWRDMTA